MRMLSRVCSVLASVSLCLLVFSSVSASADDINTRKYINADAWLDFYDTLDGYYLNTSGQYVSCNFRFVRWCDASGTIFYPNNHQYTVQTSGGKWAIYAGDFTAGSSYNDFQVNKIYIDTQFHFHNCEYIEFGILGYMYPDCGTFQNLNYNSVSNFNYFQFFSPSLNAGYQVKLGGNSNLSNPVTMLCDNSDRWSGCYYSMGNTISTDIVVKDISLSCVQNQSGDPLYFAIQLPYVSGSTQLFEPYIPPDSDIPSYSYTDDTAIVSGVISDGTTTQSINVTVQQDNNGLIGGILSGLRNLFVPSSEYLNSFTSDLQDEWSEHLGGVSEAVDLIDEQADYFENAVSVNTIYFPGLTLPLGGESYQIMQSQNVELRPANTSDGLSELWDAVAFAIDVVCVLAVLNMLQTKYEIFLNPDGEVIDYDN